MVRWLRWHCPPDTGFEIRALAVWGRACHLSVTEAPHNTNFHTGMGKKHFCFFQTAETGNRTPSSGVKGSGANHYPRAPAPLREWLTKVSPRNIEIIPWSHRHTQCDPELRISLPPWGSMGSEVKSSVWPRPSRSLSMASAFWRTTVPASGMRARWLRY